jgi:hypothetical protein
VGLIGEKTRGRKSRDTVPLNKILGNKMKNNKNMFLDGIYFLHILTIQKHQSQNGTKQGCYSFHPFSKIS